METLTAYHYSSAKFDIFDETKADGFWFTDISPENTELLDEIGASGSKFCAKCEISYTEELENSSNYNVFEQLDDAGCDIMINRYEEFCDYAARSNSQIKIIEWIEI